MVGRSLLAAVAALLLAFPAAAQVSFVFMAASGEFTAESDVGAAAFDWGTFGVPPQGLNAWYTLGHNNVSVSSLTSPLLQVVADGTVTGSLRHVFRTEADLDGLQLQYRVNGGAYQTIPRDLITGLSYGSAVQAAANSAIAGQFAFNGQSPGFGVAAYDISDFTLGTGPLPFATGVAQQLVAGDLVQFRFLSVTNDSGDVGDPYWYLGRLELNNVDFASVPEPSVVLLAAVGVAGALSRSSRWHRHRSRPAQTDRT